MELGSITSGLAGIKAATTIVKTLATSGAVLEQAELKLRLAEVMTWLSDAQIALIESREGLAEGAAEMARLKEALALQGQVEKVGDAYYRLDERGRASGDPLCLNCWEGDHRLRHLTTLPGNSHARSCPSCAHQVDWRRIRLPQEPTEA